MKSPILGSSYVTRSVNAADNRMVNLYPEVILEGGKEAGFLTRCPGLVLLANMGDGPIRGQWAFGGYGYIVSGQQLYKLDSDYTSTLLGTVIGNDPVSMADNGTQLFIAANPRSYIFNSVTNVFSEITDPDFAGALTVGFLSGYFVFSQPNSQTLWVTALFDGTLIDPLDFTDVTNCPNGIIAIIVSNQQLWVFGAETTEVYYVTGDPDPDVFPLSQIQGAYNEIGCAATFSVCKMDNSVFWLGSDTRGTGIIYRSNGYNAVRISTHAVEWQIQQYSDTSDAIAYTYQQDGHSFYVITFPSANATWVYDSITNVWHERAGFENGEFIRHRSNCQMFFNNKNIVGDYDNGNIYAFDLDVYSDNGEIQKWYRSWRALNTDQNNLKRSSHHVLQLDCETGVGLNLGQGSDPQVMLQWSDDGGHTWSNEYWKSMGQMGQYGFRTIWRRLGMTIKLRDRVYAISGTDPVKIAIMGVELYVTPTNA